MKCERTETDKTLKLVPILGTRTQQLVIAAKAWRGWLAVEFLTSQPQYWPALSDAVISKPVLHLTRIGPAKKHIQRAIYVYITTAFVREIRGDTIALTSIVSVHSTAALILDWEVQCFVLYFHPAEQLSLTPRKPVKGICDSADAASARLLGPDKSRRRCLHG